MADKVDPSGIPEFTGNLEQLEKDAKGLRGDAGDVRSTGADTHSHFQGLSAFYTAPEAEQLFATTAPVRDRADGFGDELEKVASALDEYAAEVRPIVARLRRLKADATSFVDSLKDDEDWQYDEDKVNQNNDLVQDVSTATAQFWAAERTCANKITALVGGTHWVANDGSNAKNMYGMSVADMRKAGNTPWGKAVEEKHHWYEVGHWVKSFVWDGICVDGIWGTLKGLGGLVGLQGGEVFKQSWKGLGQLATGLGMMSAGGALAYNLMPNGAVKDWMSQSMNTTKEVGKSLVAWDEWGKNPGRAAGLTVFNVVTTVCTGGAGAASKLGKAGEVASTAGKVARVVDPMTYVSKGVGAGLAKLPKVSEVTAGLKDLTAVKGGQFPDGSLHTPDGSLHVGEAPDLPPGKSAVELPDGSVQLPGGGHMAPDGTLHHPDGNIHQPGHEAPTEPPGGERGPDSGAPAGDRVPEETGPPDRTGEHGATPEREPALVGAGHGQGHGRYDLPGHAGEHAPAGPHGEAPAGPHRDVADGSGGSGGHAGDHLPRGSADGPPGGPGPHGPGEPNGPHDGGGSGGPHGAHDGGGGGHEGGSGGGHHGPPGSGGHEGGSGPGGHEPGGPGGHEGGSGDNSPSAPGGSGHPDPGGHPPGSGAGDDITSVEDVLPGHGHPLPDHAPRPNGPMHGNQEADVTHELARARLDPNDQQRVLTQLRKSQHGARVAELIGSGRLAGIHGYDEVLKMFKDKNMNPAGAMALEHADFLRERGIPESRLEFELKNEETGLDLDVATRADDGTLGHGYQLKDVDNIEGISSAVRKTVKQLLPPGAERKVGLLDVHKPIADLDDKTLGKVVGAARKTGSTYHLRFDDGSITVTEGGRILR